MNTLLNFILIGPEFVVHFLYNCLHFVKIFQSHFLSKHYNVDDINIKPQYRVGKGPLQVAVPQEQVHIDDHSREESSEDEYAPPDDDDFEQDEEEEHFAQESYRALK
jgi:hypothetical protein